MNHFCAHMDPKSLEELLFLYFNQELWANDASVIDKAIAWNKREKAEAVTAATAAAAAASTAADTVEDFLI